MGRNTRTAVRDVSQMRGVLFVMLLGGCFPTRSDELACAASADCDPGRTCETGFCVVAPDAPAEEIPNMVDAPTAPPDVAIDSPPRPCTGGDASASDPDGNCFVAFKTAKKTRAAAEAACEADTMTLAIIETAASNTTVQSLITGLDAWLGATDLVTENTFLWPDTTPLTFKNFRAGEPNNGDGNGQEDCLVIEGGKGGTWDDRPCALVLAYVCSFSR